MDNIDTEDVCLVITEKIENSVGASHPFDSTQKSFNFTSGRIETIEKYSPGTKAGATKLHILARIYLPAGEGLCPAFWSYDNLWPTKEEIDILEFRGTATHT